MKPANTEFDYADYLHLADLKPGDIVDVASDFLSVAVHCRIRGLMCRPEGFLRELERILGDTGTVMVRTFNWDWCHGVPFDRRRTPSQTGSLGNTALRDPAYRRTRHPIYSWCVWGRDADLLAGYDSVTGFGVDSVFSYLYDSGAKMLRIGNPPNSSISMIHYAEVMARVPYRREKVFRGSYTDDDGSVSEKAYSMHVRPVNMDVSTAPFEGATQDLLRDAGIRRDFLYGEDLGIGTVDLRAAADFIAVDFAGNDGRRIIRINGADGINGNLNHFETAQF